MTISRIDAAFRERRPDHCLPQYLYNAPEAFDFDMAVMFGQNWLMAGFACELPKTGSYISQMIGKWPIVAANVVCLIMSAATLILKFRFERGNTR